MDSYLVSSAHPMPSVAISPCHGPCGLHQVAPYIGKLRPSISEFLLSKYTKLGDIVADPFCGSGTIPLDAVRLGRIPIAADCSEYAIALTKAKLLPPASLEEAILRLENSLRQSKEIRVDLRSVPAWVRQFFHPETLRGTVAFVEVLKKNNEHFLLACLLGILHHQRPGFLSYPSSHLVPYLRSTLFPRVQFPELYEYRDIRSRMLRKIERTYKLMPPAHTREMFDERDIRIVTAKEIAIWKTVDAIVTSPPYMNALDYVRDNRLRLWFLSGSYQYPNSAESTRSRSGFTELMKKFIRMVSTRMKIGGNCVVIVGETANRCRTKAHPAQVIWEQVREHSKLEVIDILSDEIPDIRRSRKEGRATKREIVLVIRRTS